LGLWIDQLPDPRNPEWVQYERKFLIYGAILMFALRLGSRRAFDQDLRDPESEVLHNLNLLAGTQQITLPVARTIDDYLHQMGGPQPLVDLRHRCMHRLIRMKALDHFRLVGHVVILIDGTGFLSFGERHCAHCLTQKHESKTVYLHPVLEAKLVTPDGLALSIATEFIENPGPITQAVEYTQEQKQDCELKAFARLAQQLKEHFPQLRICLSADSLYACGPFFEICRQYGWSYVVTFKPGRLPSLWKDFEGLLTLEPHSKAQQKVHLPDGAEQVYQWVEPLDYRDSEGRDWQPGAIICQETHAQKETTTFAWLTNLEVNRDSVLSIAKDGGRIRSKIENEGFNVQKNSGLNLEHAYSLDWEVAKAYYYLLQIGHLLDQLVQHGSLHRALAKEYGKQSVAALWGALKKIYERLKEAFRTHAFAPEDFDVALAKRCHISLNSS
jgi:hypothetical protein